MELSYVPASHSTPQVQTIDVLCDDELHLPNLNQLSEGHVGLGGLGLIPADVHVRLLALLLQRPDTFGTSEIGNSSRS